MSECEGTCLYCETALAARHEHDHVPTPRRAGGTETYCVCLGCHELKDRTPFYKWPDMESFKAFWGIWEKASSTERIWLVKAYAIMQEDINKKEINP